MKNIKQTIALLKFNWRTLLVFETLYRFLGLAVIFPIAERILYFSVTLTGNEYVINRNFIDYIFTPTTIILLIILYLFFGLYVAFEIVVLSILFHSNRYQQKIGIQTLLITAFRKYRITIQKYHFTILSSSMIFLFLVEGLHIVGIASTIKLPVLITEQLNSEIWLVPMVLIVAVVSIVLFIETMFYEIQCTIEQTSIKTNFSRSREILRKNRLQLLFEFFVINGIINLLIYLFYLLLIGIIALTLYIFTFDNFVYPFILTILYSVYLIIGFVATIILIPINFAWINSIYYNKRKTNGVLIINEIKGIMANRPFKKTVFYRMLVGILVLLVAITIFNLTAVSKNPSRLELLNNPSVIAHRGGGFYAPENTISGIEKGIEYGADAIEMDIRFTVDGVPILMHDATLGRTTNDLTNAAVNTLSLETIKTLDAGSWFDEVFTGETVPTLEEALMAIDGRSVAIIELKASYPNAEEIVYEIIKNYNMEHKSIVMSFDENLIKGFKELDNQFPTVLLLSTFIGDVNLLAEKEYVDYYGIKYDIAVGDKQYIRELQQRGKGIYIWTVNSKDTMAEINSLGVDGIITDYPLIAREVIYSDHIKSTYAKLLEILFTRDN